MLTELTNNIIKVKNNITGKYYNVKAANDKEANLLASMSKEALYKNRLRNLNATLYSMKSSEYLKNCEPKGLYYINDLRQYKAINKNIINNLYDKKVISELQRDIYLKINKEDGIKWKHSFYVFWHKLENVAICFLKTSVNEFNNETILNISDFVEGQNLDFEKYNFDSKAYLFRFKSEVDMELFFSRIEILAKQGMFESEKHKELFFEAVVKYINLKKEIIVEENNIYFNMEDHIKNNIDFLILLTKAEKDNIYDILLKTYTQSKGLLLNKNKVSFEDTIKSDASKELIKVPSPKEEL